MAAARLAPLILPSPARRPPSLNTYLTSVPFRTQRDVTTQQRSFACPSTACGLTLACCFAVTPRRPANEFHYLNQSSCYHLATGNNSEEYERTKSSMGLVGMKDGETDAVMQTVAAILHLGNVAFVNDAKVGAIAWQCLWVSLCPACALH